MMMRLHTSKGDSRCFFSRGQPLCSFSALQAHQFSCQHLEYPKALIRYDRRNNTYITYNYESLFLYSQLDMAIIRTTKLLTFCHVPCIISVQNAWSTLSEELHHTRMSISDNLSQLLLSALALSGFFQNLPSPYADCCRLHCSEKSYLPSSKNFKHDCVQRQIYDLLSTHSMLINKSLQPYLNELNVHDLVCSEVHQRVCSILCTVS